MEHQATAASPAGKPPRKTARRKTSGARKVARRRKPSRRARAKGGSASFAALLEKLTARASEAGAGVAALSGEGATAARRTLAQATAASRKTIGRLTKEWKNMDTQRKAQVVAAVLGALAAASAPFVRSRMRGK